MGCLLFDLSAAFDCVDKDIMDQKLGVYNFDSTARKWIYSYLSDRSQRVKVGKKLK